ncbi:MAG: DUF4230 domain-containing protein [Merismopedia sp. SIO2A8]|nr:DUF4230 domain-containing protein [Symploca sp. SIO2B6]NET47489.1 DUF4230 domain-containing protein [Merismopedia sp. SIO2A8]
MGRTWSNLMVLTRIGLLVLCCVMAVSLWRTGRQWTGGILNGMGALLNSASAKPEAEVETHHLLLKQVRGVSELTTAILTTESVIPTRSDRTLGSYVIGTTRLLYIAHGEVKAGIDLTNVGPNDILLDENSLTIQLPPPVILDRKIDVEKSQVYDYDRGFLGLGPDTAPELQTLAQQTTLGELVIAACDHGLLEQANERAVTALSQLFNVTNQYEFVDIQTQPPAPETCALP